MSRFFQEIELVAQRRLTQNSLVLRQDNFTILSTKN